MRVQDLTLETADLALFTSMLRAAVTVLGTQRLYHRPRATWSENDPLVDQYPSAEAAYMTHFCSNAPFQWTWQPPSERRAPHYWHVCRLVHHPYYLDKPEPFEEPIPFSSPDEAVERVLELVRAADKEEFEKRTGEGPFSGCDGSVGVGYRMWSGARTGAVHISLCHIYYSK